MNLARLSLNQATVENLGLFDVLDACVDAGIGAVAVWRHKLAGVDLGALRQALDDRGLRVSSLCRGGMFPAPSASERQARIDDNRRAVEEAAALGADTLVLVCGPPYDRDLRGAREQIRDGIATLVPFAAEHGVRLGIEPLHPMMIAERSALCTLAEALAVCDEIDSAALGVIVDAYHVWWEPDLDALLRRATGSIVGFHVSDWLVPTTDILRGRGLMGDGIIPLREISAGVVRAGYDGLVEVEVLNPEVWARPTAPLLTDVKRRFETYV